VKDNIATFHRDLMRVQGNNERAAKDSTYLLTLSNHRPQLSGDASTVFTGCQTLTLIIVHQLIDKSTSSFRHTHPHSQLP